MSVWQRRARVVIAVFAVAFIIVLVFAFKRRAPVPVTTAVPRTDPNAVVETTGGTTQRFKGTREDVGVDYEKLLTYEDGSTKMLGVTIRTENRGGGRSFTVTAKQGDIAKNESQIALTGDIRLAANDGFTARTEHATYEDKEGVVRAPGPVEFGRARMSGTGKGLTYDKAADVLTILEDASVRMAPDERGAGSADIAAATAEFRRRDRQILFGGGVKVLRSGQIIEAGTATAFLTADEKHVDALELRGNSRITGAHPAPGGLQSLTGRDMNLTYAADGETLEHALIVGAAVMQFAGEQGRPGRQISCETIDVALGPDGTTPTMLAGRDNVVLTFPADQGAGERVIRARALDAKGQGGKGLTNAHFTGDVQYREVNGAAERNARSQVLDATLRPGMGAIEEAQFADGVRFGQGAMFASAAAARYVLRQGVLQLSGTEPANPVPHMLTDRITIDAAKIDVTLDGPKVKADGNVKSVLQPAKKDDAKAGRMPAMLKQDQPVNVTSARLEYDGTNSNAVYSGQAQLWQADTTVRADTLTVDDKRGDLTGSGSVATSVMLEQTNKNTKAKERVRSLGSAQDFKYEDEPRRATYTTDAHLAGPEGEMTAGRIELYLKPSGDELDRAEAYTAVTLRETSRKTTGDRLTYFAVDERYVVTGAPVRIVDECERETIGRTLTFFKATDTILVDGNQRIRTQTKGGGKCSGS